MAVSYTHLDVYKRQGYGAPGGPVCDRYQPDDPAQERDGHSGGQRPPGCLLYTSRDVVGQTNELGTALEEVHIGEAVVQRLTEGNCLKDDEADDPGEMCIRDSCGDAPRRCSRQCTPAPHSAGSAAGTTGRGNPARC